MTSNTTKLGLNKSALLSIFALLIMAVSFVWWSNNKQAAPWTAEELIILNSLWLENLAPLPADRSNAVADSTAAAKLGQQIFFDSRFSVNGEVSCASCHQPQLLFTDGLNKAIAIGQTARHTPSLVGVAYSPWFYWDGRKDSQWSQALAPLEDPKEHGGNRMQFARLISADETYRLEYEALFGSLPDFSDESLFPLNAGPVSNSDWNAAWLAMSEENRDLVNTVFANIGKVIAAYERQLMPSESRFDYYLESLFNDDIELEETILTTDEVKGLRLFIDEARCIECHNGPLFTNNEFHNTGLLPSPGELPDQGRTRVLQQLLEDPFNCYGEYSDADREFCTELTYMRINRTELLGAMRTPSLRNISTTAPYMHKGQIATLSEVLKHYNQAELAFVGHNEAEPIGLSRRQMRQIEQFLGTLDSPIVNSLELGAPPSAN